TLKVCVPATNAALAGRMALLSLEVIPAMSVMVFTRFQLASTALTVTLKAVPAVCAVGAPVLPVALPGEAVSPGARICSLVNAPTLTAISGLVLFVTLLCVTSEAVVVALPAVFRVIPLVNILVPATSAALDGRAALLSLEVMD